MTSFDLLKIPNRNSQERALIDLIAEDRRSGNEKSLARHLLQAERLKIYLSSKRA